MLSGSCTKETDDLHDLQDSEHGITESCRRREGRVISTTYNENHYFHVAEIHAGGNRNQGINFAWPYIQALKQN